MVVSDPVVLGGVTVRFESADNPLLLTPPPVTLISVVSPVVCHAKLTVLGVVPGL